MSTPGAEAANDVREAASDGLRAAAERLLARASVNAPKTDPDRDPNPAKPLAELGSVEMSPDGRVATVRFEGPYAAKHHEAKHFEHPRGGKAKFLEDELKAMLAGELEAIVAGNVRARMRARER